jgi:hypothetical protein
MLGVLTALVMKWIAASRSTACVRSGPPLPPAPIEVKMSERERKKVYESECYFLL